MHAPEDLERCPLMPTYGPPALMFVRGEGRRLWDVDGNEYLDFLSGARRHQPRPLPPGGGRRARRAGPHAAPRVEPVRHRARLGGRPHPRPPAGRRRPGVLRQLRRRGQRVRAQAGPQVRGPRPPRRRQRARLVPRPHAGHPPRHRPAREARGVPAAARGLPPRRLERPRRARELPSTRPSRRSCSSRCRARAA